MSINIYNIIYIIYNHIYYTHGGAMVSHARLMSIYKYTLIVYYIILMAQPWYTMGPHGGPMSIIYYIL